MTRYTLAITQAAARAAHRELAAQPALYVRIATLRGQRRLVQIDSHGDPYPVFCSKRAWRDLIYRTPLSREFGGAS